MGLVAAVFFAEGGQAIKGAFHFSQPSVTSVTFGFLLRLFCFELRQSEAVARAVLAVGPRKPLGEGGAMPVNKQAGAPITELRRRLKMTQEEFAHAIGVTVSTVNRWENGHIEPSRLARKAIEGLVAQAPSTSDYSEASVAFSAKEA
ncbi:MAG: helix-turn-helix domain-containing protein [Candidatus Binatia bacterium]